MHMPVDYKSNFRAMQDWGHVALSETHTGIKKSPIKTMAPMLDWTSQAIRKSKILSREK